MKKLRTSLLKSSKHIYIRAYIDSKISLNWIERVKQLGQEGTHKSFINSTVQNPQF